MARIIFIQADGTARIVEAEEGISLMQAATTAGIPGIVGECGGSCSCATCHVVLAPEDLARLPAMGDTEGEMLDFAAGPRTAGSRLGCQVIVTQELSGLRVEVPEAQV